MTTEDDFQAALDACPEDWQTRLVYADWLDERGDPRGPGYRALGKLRMCPRKDSDSDKAHQDGRFYYSWRSARSHRTIFDGTNSACVVPDDWFALITLGTLLFWYHRDTRREAEDAAARAFAGLPTKRRRKLLASEVAARG